MEIGDGEECENIALASTRGSIRAFVCEDLLSSLMMRFIVRCISSHIFPIEMWIHGSIYSVQSQTQPPRKITGYVSDFVQNIIHSKNTFDKLISCIDVKLWNSDLVLPIKLSSLKLCWFSNCSNYFETFLVVIKLIAFFWDATDCQII